MAFPRKKKERSQSDLHIHDTPTDNAFSDSEAAYGRRRPGGQYYQLASSLPGSFRQPFNALGVGDDGLNTDDDLDNGGSPYHDFAENQGYGNRVVRTGRQRKNEIDVQKLLDYLVGAGDLLFDWKFELHNDVLHLYKPGAEDPSKASQSFPIVNFSSKEDEMEHATTPKLFTLSSSNPGSTTNPLHVGNTQSALNSLDAYLLSKVQEKNTTGELLSRQDSNQESSNPNKVPHSLSGYGAREVFVFDFGAAVFWGFPRGEEAGLLKTIRMFVTKGMVGTTEFESGEDDMAFVISPEEKSITIANDVISLPEDSLSKQRLAVSFAIAQSSVLAIFEARIEQKVEEYKYIPEALAAYGKVHLSERQLGMMIGEVFVIRHDVNLHTEILDTPDFFWKEKIFESDYKMVSSYLEMSGRTEILNKRLDMLRELLEVLQQQMENAHAVKLEWIVIYLIVAEVVLQGLAIVVDNLI
eukprot:gene8113-8952_t